MSTEGSSTQSQLQNFSTNQESFVGSGLTHSEANGYGTNGVVTDSLSFGGNLGASSAVRHGYSDQGALVAKGIDASSQGTEAEGNATDFTTPSPSTPSILPMPFFGSGPMFTGFVDNAPVKGSAASPPKPINTQDQTAGYRDTFRGVNAELGMRTNVSGTNSESPYFNTTAASNDTAGERTSTNSSVSDMASQSQSMRMQDGTANDARQSHSTGDSGIDKHNYDVGSSTHRADMQQASQFWGERAVANNNPMMLQTALAQHGGNAMDTLWDLNQNQGSRQALVNAAEQKFQLQDNLGDIGQGDRGRVEAQGQAQLNQLRARVAADTLPQANPQGVRVGGFTPQNHTPAYTPAEREARMLQAGVVKATQAYFAYQQTGALSVGDRAVLGGKFYYTSPEVMAQDLVRKAQANPTLAKFLRDNSFRSDLSNQAFFDALSKFY